jgi:CRISPR-associated endonuclease/helicase Cas3
MASLLDKSPAELKVTPEFICVLHKDAFEGLFPSWAGRYRDRNVKVGDYEPPPYYEVSVLMRTYCDDLEFRLSSFSANPPDPAMLIEAFAFAEGRLLSIHPFRDFNGRVTRMLLFSLLCRFDMPPVRLVPDEKDSAETDEYLNALTEADRINWQPLIMIWRKRLGLETKE